MRSAALIRYDLHKHLGAVPNFNDRAPWGDYTAQRVAWQTRDTKLRADLVIAERRELKRLAKVLTYKADIYGPTGRIFSFDAKWAVRDDVLGKAYLFHGDKIIDPEQLCDGHGRTITLPD